MQITENLPGRGSEFVPSLDPADPGGKENSPQSEHF
jgi:hypothetical protein